MPGIRPISGRLNFGWGMHCTLSNQSRINGSVRKLRTSESRLMTATRTFWATTKTRMNGLWNHFAPVLARDNSTRTLARLRIFIDFCLSVFFLVGSFAINAQAQTVEAQKHAAA